MYTAYLRDFGTLVLRRMTMALSCYIVSDIFFFLVFQKTDNNTYENNL